MLGLPQLCWLSSWGLFNRQAEGKGVLKENPSDTPWSIKSHLQEELEQCRTLLPAVDSPSSVTARSTAKAVVNQLNEARRETALDEDD